MSDPNGFWPSLVLAGPKLRSTLNFFLLRSYEKIVPSPNLPPAEVRPNSVVPDCTRVPWSGVAPSLPSTHVGVALLGQLKLCRTLILLHVDRALHFFVFLG